MEKNEHKTNTFENNMSRFEASLRKGHIISDIMEKADQSEEEENKGRS